MGVHSRDATVDEIVALVPHEVGLQIKELFGSEEQKAADKKERARPKLKRSTTQSISFADLSKLPA